MPCVEYPLCKHGYYGGESVPIIMCNGDGSPCGFQRYCTDLKKSIHVSSYVNCKKASILIMKKEIKTQPKNEKPSKMEVCHALYENGIIHIDFKGFGITYKNINRIETPTVNVIYSGVIGQSDFKICEVVPIM